MIECDRFVSMNVTRHQASMAEPAHKHMPTDPPLTDSRRLTGNNVYFDATGAALETAGIDVDTDLVDSWRVRIASARSALDWMDGPIVARTHARGASLAFAAPLDQLYSATEINEWAWLATLDASAHALEYDRFLAPGHAAVWDQDIALPTLRALAAAEAMPAMVTLINLAQARGLTWLLDEDALTLGEGNGSRTWSVDALPGPEEIEWSTLHDIPIALVTGSNGKTTTVRLLAAMARTHGWRTGHSCSDGLFVDGASIDAGDFSGPMGARRVLREADVEAAILETARGGILRRGLAVQRAQVAVITNITPDHYGEYGIHDLDALAQVKLVVARAVGSGGLLVLNADDPVSRAQIAGSDHARFGRELGWFALDDDDALLRAHRERGGATAGVHDGRMRLFIAGQSHDLGAVAEMPLTIHGSASYNIANLLGAALGAAALGVAPAQIAKVLARFGSTHEDNPGRLQHWSLGGVEVWLDYAHNPDGLRGLLDVARNGHPHGRLGLILGQAGNRTDADIRKLAATAASFVPGRTVIKEMEGLLRGRALGETAAILRDELLARGVDATSIASSTDEILATRAMLEWAQPDDILVLPIHGKQARDEISAWLDRLVHAHWRPGQPLD
jgi:cyanophycin synthetase